MLPPLYLDTNDVRRVIYLHILTERNEIAKNLAVLTAKRYISVVRNI